MVRELRKGRGKNGFVLANGGVVTYEYVVCLSSKPRNSPFPDRNPLPEYVADEPIPPVDEKAEGEAVIEVSFNTNYHHDLADCTVQTYTVEFNRDGTPSTGYIVGRLKSNNHRFVANHGDENTLQQLASGVKEPIGRGGWVSTAEEGRNVFTFDKSGKL
jgi:hypothetical protein